MRKKALDVAKFGGTEKLGKGVVHGYDHEVESIETQSKRHLEEDMGQGAAAIIRCFTFGINPVAFKEHQPTKQELFNSHIKGIEVMLWRDGMTLMLDVEPRVLFDQQAMTYKIFVGARPARGHLLTRLQVPRTLKEIVHG